MREATTEELNALGNALSPVERAIRLEKLKPHQADFVRSLNRQEELKRPDGTYATSNRGAYGPMQIIPDTFKAYQDEGWNIENPDHSAQAGVRYAMKLLEKANNDPRVAAAGYYSGEGGMADFIRGKYRRDKVNPKAPNTKGYSDSVSSRLPKLREAAADELATAEAYFNKTAKAAGAYAVDKLAAYRTPPHQNAEHKLKDFADMAYQNLGSDELSKQIYLDSQKLPFGTKTMIGAGRELHKLGAGLHKGNLFLQDKMGFQGAAKELEEQALQQAEEDRLYKGFDAAVGIPKHLGGAIPYFITGEVGGPVINKVVGKGLNLLTKPFSATGNILREGAATAAGSLTKSPYALPRAVGKKMQSEIVTPSVEAALSDSLHPVLQHPLYKDFWAKQLGSGALGGAEGAAHYDSNFEKGAVSSMVGHNLGLVSKTKVSRVPNFRTDTDKEVLNWYERQGGKLSPGLETGSQQLQNFESQIAKGGPYADTAALYKQENQLVDNNIAYKAMGIDAPVGTHLTPAELAEHHKALKKGYDEIAANTLAKFNKDDIDFMRSHVKDLYDAPTDEAKKIATNAYKYLNAIENNIKGVTFGGKTNTSSMSGKALQRIRSNLKNDIDLAYKENNNAKVDAYKPLLKRLEAGIEAGIGKEKGAEALAKYKDLDNKFAMTDIVLKHGLSPSGVDASRLLSYFEGRKAKEFYLEQGSKEMTDLHKLAKVEYYRKNTNKSLAGLKNEGDMTTMQQLVSHPDYLYLSPLKSLYMHMYHKGWPVKTGLLGMGENTTVPLGPFKARVGNLWEGPELYTRAIAQSNKTGSETVPRVAKTIASIVKKIPAAAGKSIDFFDDVDTAIANFNAKKR
jgi:hypothetical protein